MNLFDVVPIMESLTVDDITNTVNEFFDEIRMTECQVIPKK